MILYYKKSLARLERRIKENILSKPKSIINYRSTPSGHPGPGSPTFGKIKSRKGSTYKTMLLECRKVRMLFGLSSEHALRLLLSEAERKKGDTGKNLFELLETKLLSVVYRTWAASPGAARQLISHKKIMVNGSVVNRKLYSLKVGDKVSILESLDNPHISIAAKSKEHNLPSYIELKENKRECVLVKEPTLETSKYGVPLDFKRVIEFYSK